MQSALFDRRRRGAVVARLLPFNSIIEGQNAEPWPGKRVTASPHPDQGLITALPNGGHCGGDGSVLRLRAVVAMANWRGPRHRFFGRRGVFVDNGRSDNYLRDSTCLIWN
jgi:hypothetical protein